MCDTIEREELRKLESTDRSNIEFMLSPDVPEEHRKHFIEWWTMIEGLNAMANIKREEIASSLLAFDEIVAIMEIGDYQWAYEEMARELMLVQKTRGVEGFATQYLAGHVERQFVHSVNREAALRENRKKWFNRTRRAISGNNAEPPMEEMKQ